LILANTKYKNRTLFCL